MAIAASPGAISISTVTACCPIRLLPGVLLLAAGCAGTPAVVTSSGGPVIAQPQSPPSPAADNAAQYRVAVSAFDYKATQRANIGQGLADMLADALSNSGRFQPQMPAPTGQTG